MTFSEVKRSRGRPKGSKGEKRALSKPTAEIIPVLKSKLSEDDNGCWVFDGTPSATGHANLYCHGQVQGGAHRVAYEVWVGPIPKGKYVLQKCGNKLCCNPEHLYLAGFDEVMRLRGEAGKSIRGGRNPKAKLSREQVDQIRERALNKEPLARLSEEFGVSRATISQIKNGNIWKD